MHQDNTLVSVIIPSFNRVTIIAETLKSVLLQTYQNWECIVVDDGSTDGTQKVINAYLNNDKRFLFIQRNREPKGAPTCRNIGVEHALGKYLVFLDSDDLLGTTCLENRIKIAKTYPDNDFWVFGTAQFSNTPGDSSAIWNVLNKNIDDLQRFILQDAPWHTMGPLWKKTTILDLGGFNESAICWQDWELHIRALLKNFKYWKSLDNDFDTFYRNNKLNKSNTISANQNKLSHILFRIDLFNNFYEKINKTDQRKEIKNAFGVLYFRIFLELYEHNETDHLKKLFYQFKVLGIYCPVELFLIRFLLLDFENKKIDGIKFKVIHKLLIKRNRNKFNNLVNTTFQN